MAARARKAAREERERKRGGGNGLSGSWFATTSLPSASSCTRPFERILRGLFFFALCCLGKIPGGAPFSQLHKSGNGSRVDRP